MKSVSDIESKVEGELVKDHVLISDKNMQNGLEQKGFGEIIKKKFFLKPFESLYLLYLDKLKLTRGGQQINFDSMMQECIKFDNDILTKFLVYRDLRTKGYIAKDGFGFGSDFRVYERGQFGEKGAKYVVFGINEGKREKMGLLQKQIEQIAKMGKEPVIAVIERRGEVIYYKISRIKFLENKEQSTLSPIEF
jgi:tRNA-intron endonuclease